MSAVGSRALTLCSHTIPAGINVLQEISVIEKNEQNNFQKCKLHNLTTLHCR